MERQITNNQISKMRKTYGKIEKFQDRISGFFTAVPLPDHRGRRHKDPVSVRRKRGRTRPFILSRTGNAGNGTAYALHYEKDYRFLNYEYPLHTASIDKQMEFAYAWHQKTGWLPLAFLSAPGNLRRLSEFRCVFVELNFVFIYYASGMQLYSK